MTGSDLIQRLAVLADVTERDAQTALSAVLITISHAVKQGHRVELRGFGSFSVRQRESREARNPRTGKRIQVAAKRVMHFKAGRQLLKALNGDSDVLAGIQERREEQCRRRDERGGQLRLF